MRNFLKGILVFAFFVFVGAKAEPPMLNVELDCSDVLVVGAPYFVTVDIENQTKVQYPVSIAKIDMASKIETGLGLFFLFESDEHSPIQVGHAGFGLPSYDYGGSQSEIIGLSGGEKVEYTFDLIQSFFGNDLRKPETIPTGKYRIACSVLGSYKSKFKEVTIREPTPDEKRFIEAIQKQGIGKKWFPAVITDDDLKIPEDIPLTGEMAQLRDFIKALRLAVRKPDEAVKQIDARKETWGHLQGAIAELKYECVAKTKGKDSEAAQDLRRSLAADEKTKGRLTRIEKAGGLLEHFAELKAAKNK